MREFEIILFQTQSFSIKLAGSTPNLDMKVSRSLDPVFRADLCIGEIEILCLSRCRNSGGDGGGGGVREKY